MDKIAIIIIGVIVVVAVIFVGVYLKNPNSPGVSVSPAPLPEGNVLFFGDGCPHCKNVDDFVVQNNIEEKVPFTRLEIPYGGKTSPELESNAALIAQLAGRCNIDASNGVGIPFLWDGQNCTVGDEPVINFFKNAAGIQ